MIITIKKDNEPTVILQDAEALWFFREFRQELWLAGTRRDPKAGDALNGITIINISA